MNKVHEFAIKKKKRSEFRFRFARASFHRDVPMVTVRITSLAAFVGVRGQLPIVSAAGCASPDKESLDRPRLGLLKKEREVVDGSRETRPGFHSRR